MIILVARRQLPNAVVNRRLAEIMRNDYPWLDSSVDISFNQFQSWLVNKNDSILCDSLSVWIEEFKNSPEARRLEQIYGINQN